MDKKSFRASLRSAAGRHASRRGAFSAGLAALAVVVVVVFNLLVAQLPETWSQIDMSGTGIYEISQTSQELLAGMEENVEIHVLAAEESVDSRIVRFLSKYEALSDHLSVEYIDPVVYPSILSQYGVEDNTIVVTCEATGRQESFSIGDIIGYDLMSYYYYGTTQETDFDAEGLLTSAVDGVLTGTTRTIYATTGHGETALGNDVTERFQKSHITVESLNLLTDGGIPDDCSLLILNAPTEDLADDELEMLLEYLSTGGQVLYTMASDLTQLPNFETLCSTYGMSVTDGMIADTSRYYQNNPYWIFPMMDTSVDAASTLDSDAVVLVFASRGMTLTDPVRDTITVSSFLTTSENGYSVVDETNQTQGTYVVGAVATEDIDDNITARLTVLGTTSLTDESLTASFSNLDNTDLFLGAATAGFDDLSTLSISPVSLETPVNTITTGSIWALLFIFVIPGGLLIFGFVHWMRRRKL